MLYYFSAQINTIFVVGSAGGGNYIIHCLHSYQHAGRTVARILLVSEVVRNAMEGGRFNAKSVRNKLALCPCIHKT